ncbi:MAG: 6-carboxytetrahydropterin synthase [Victivallales bacterium]|nr:6-carboxytetrahydropterin synthase [Victivallales bacterium]MCF7888929.1 6-carboxytetrahydropterin synthase [Victivallales bacterium]
MYRVCKTFRLETGHFLTSQQTQSDCRMPHGHSRTVEIIISAENLDESNMVFDFQAFKAAFGDYLNSLDHAMYINSSSKHFKYFKDNFEKVIAFEGDPTSEVIAEVMFKHFDKVLKKGTVIKTKNNFYYKITNDIRLERVRLWETSTSWAEYSRN